MADELPDRRDARCLAARLLLAGLIVLALAAFGWRTFIRPHQADVPGSPSVPPPTPPVRQASPPVPKEPPPRLWEAAVAGRVLALAAADLDGDGRADIVACCENGDVLALSGADGSTTWTFEAKSRLTPPAIADLDGDGRMDLLVGTEDGRAIALAGDGSVLWIHRALERVFQVGAADLDHDGAADAVIAYPRGVKALSGRTATQIALIEYPRPGEVHFALGDLDGDGTTDWVANYKEAEFHTRGVSGRDASTLWMRQMGEEVLTVPSIGDLDLDGRQECVYVSAASGDVLVLQGGTGREVRRYAMEGQTGTTTELADADADGALDIFVVGYVWLVVLSGKDGSRLWSSASLMLAPIVCDIEGGGPAECVVADAAGIAVRAARSGSQLARVLPHEISRVRPVVADLDGNGRLDVVAAVDGQVIALTIPRK